MWATHFVRNGNKLSISSWLATEVQVCRNVGRPNPRLPNLVSFIICLFWITILLMNQWSLPLFSNLDDPDCVCYMAYAIVVILLTLEKKFFLVV